LENASGLRVARYVGAQTTTVDIHHDITGETVKIHGLRTIDADYFPARLFDKLDFDQTPEGLYVSGTLAFRAIANTLSSAPHRPLDDVVTAVIDTRNQFGPSEVI